MESMHMLLLTFAVGAIGVLVYCYRQVTFWARKGIPHVPSVPILGNNVPLFFRKTSVFEFMEYLYNLFPEARYFGIMDFSAPVVILRDPELIKELCVKNFDNFMNHRNFIDEETDPVFGKNVFALHGERWKELRSTLSPSFTTNKMKFMFQLISKCSHDFVEYFLNHPEMTQSLEMKDAFTRYTNDVIATAGFGISVNSLQDRNNEFYVRGKDASNFNSVLRGMKFFIFRISPQLTRLLGLTFLSSESDRFFKTIIRDTLKMRKEQNIVRPDMIHLLTEASVKENGVTLSVDDIIAQAFIFFLAGFDTSSTLMCFVAHELAMNPEVQEKLRNEVDGVTKIEGSEISYETVSKMKYMDMVISEALRKYPPAAFTDRVCNKSFTLPKAKNDCNELTLHPDNGIWIPIYALHHDPKYFPDPEKFDPERFNDENKEKIDPYTYLPFGVGPRKCIANRFALMETKILFVHILQEFLLEKTEKTKHPLEFAKIFNVTVKGGLWLKLRKRKM